MKPMTTYSTGVYQRKQCLRMCQCLMERIEPGGNCLCRSGWGCLSHTLRECFQIDGDTGMASFTTFYLRSNLSWSNRTAANTRCSHCAADSAYTSTCSLSVLKGLWMCCLGFCNVLFNDAVVITVSQLIKHSKHFGQKGRTRPPPGQTHTGSVFKC